MFGKTNQNSNLCLLTKFKKNYIIVVENEEREMVSFLQILNLKMRKKMNTDVWEHKSKF